MLPKHELLLAICELLIFPSFFRFLLCPFAFALFWRESLPHSD